MKDLLRSRFKGPLLAALILGGTAAAAQDFHVQEGNAAGGPYPIDALVAMVRDGMLTPETLVWTEGQAEWLPAGEVEALAALFTQPPPGGEIRMPVSDYYVALGNAEGPFVGETLLEMVRDGRLTASTLVWAEGMNEWTPAGQVDDLAGLLNAGGTAPPPLPPIDRQDPAGNEDDRGSPLPPPPDLDPPQDPVPDTETTETTGTDPLDDPRLERLERIELADMGVPAIDQLKAEPLHGPTPVSIPGGQVITTKGLLELRQSNIPHAVFHVLYSDEAIPGALMGALASAPGTFSDDLQERFGTYLQQVTEGRMDPPLVFYCLSTECWMSYNAALRAIKLGYTNVLWYRGGIEAWHSLGLPTEAPIQ